MFRDPADAGLNLRQRPERGDAVHHRETHGQIASLKHALIPLD